MASQNPVQANDNLYSYTLYDVQGRPEQVGQVVKTTTPDTGQDDLGAAFLAWVVAGTRTEITKTRYDRPVSTTVEALFSNGEQENLRLRVASVYYHPTHNIGIQSWLGYESAIHYSYDIHGNVKEVIQDVPALLPVEQDIKSTQYEYELISGNVEKVKFQEGELDEMSHSYIYDKVNRLTEVFTSTDDVHSTREVHYRYFDYGPLARVELGKDKVQGMDYAYTINGWLKAMNGGRLDTDLDMGVDGTNGYLTGNTDVHTLFAPDVLAYNLGYFENDYAAISAFQVEADYALTDFETASPGLYNGNIRHFVSDIFGMDRMGAAYRYDQLNRLKSMTAFFNNNTSYDWQNVLASNDYANSYTYDRNGNIENLTRRAYGANGAMDNMDYQYYSLGVEPSNRLSHVVENQTVNVWNDDITAMGTNNFTYDELGQLLSDPSEGIGNMVWRKGDKKLEKIERDNTNGADLSDVEFIYNPMGIRVLKIVKPRTAGVPSSPDEWNYTYYAYDANGQCMATYDVTMSTEQNEAILAEQHIYGSSRIGMLKQKDLIYDDGPIPPPSSSMANMYSNWAGERRYEINNYLGNVNAVLTDRKIPTSTGVPTLFEAVVVHTTDYYPGGMEMPGRDLPFDPDGEEYRYAYNGMEQDGEVSGDGNSYTTEFRQYDPRLGRWKSLDPLMAKFPWMSPYVAFDDNPVVNVDPLGLWSEKKANRKAERMERNGFENVSVVRSGDKNLNPTRNYGVSTTGKGNGSGAGHYFGKGGSKRNAPERKKEFSFWDPIGGIPRSEITTLGVSSKIFHILFKDGGTAEKLLTHYGRGGGSAYYLSNEQVKEVFPNYTDGTGERRFDLTLSNYDMQFAGPVETGDLSAYANSSGTLGQFTISMSGERTIEEVTFQQSLTESVTSTQVVFRGVVTLYDHFDFDPRGEGEDSRHGSAGFQTWVGRNFISGQGFHIYGSIEVMQIGNGPLTDLNGVELHMQGYQGKQD